MGSVKLPVFCYYMIKKSKLGFRYLINKKVSLNFPKFQIIEV